MKSWIKKYIGVVTIMACLSPIASAQTFNQNIQNHHSVWMQELKRINPKDYQLLDKEINQVLATLTKTPKNQKEMNDMIHQAIQMVYQKPEISQMMLRYLSYYAQADDETVMKFMDLRLRIMNRLLAHNDVACYDWLHSNPNPDIVAVAKYEMTLFQNVFVDILKSYDPKYAVPNDPETRTKLINAMLVALNEMPTSFDRNILEKTDLSNQEKRQFCEFQRNYITHLLMTREVDVLRYLSLDE